MTVGVVVGLMVAYALTRAMGKLVMGTSTTDIHAHHELAIGCGAACELDTSTSCARVNLMVAWRHE